jgi:hypothetical protein
VSDLDELPRVFCEGCGTEGHLRDSGCETCAYIKRVEVEAYFMFEDEIVDREAA